MRYKDICGHVNSIDGFLMPGQEEWLFNMAKSLEDKSIILEIGSYKGRSTSALAFGCVGTGKRVFTIDEFYSFKKGSSSAPFKKNMKRLGLEKYVILLEGFSEDIAQVWRKSINIPIDFLFMDGSHDYETVVNDYRNFSEFVVSGSLIALHDVFCEGHSGCTRAWRKVLKRELISHGECKSIAFGKKR